MKHFFKYCWILIFLLAIFSGCQKEEMPDSGYFESYQINSAYTGSEYTLDILYPENYDPLLEYHTIYLLDGDFYFDELAQIVSSEYASYDIILIGIGYQNENKRSADFTYPADDMVPSSGGGKYYIQFINNELIPYVENSLLIKSSKNTLVGHSYGGYFSLYLLFQQDYPNPFDNMIAASPSLFWHDAYMLDLENQYNTSNDTLSVKLYITMGGLEGVTMNTLFNAFNQIIESRDYMGLSFEHGRNEHATHNNNPVISFEKGLSLILN